MNQRRTARKQVTPQAIADNAILAYRSYSPRPGAHILRVLCRFYELWETAHEHGVTGIDGIRHLIPLLPDDWEIWTASLADDFIHRRPDTLEDEGDFPGFLCAIIDQYLRYQNVPPASPDILAPPPPQWETPTLPITEPQGQYDHEAGPSRRQEMVLPLGYDRPQGVRQFPGQEHDPTWRGKAPMIAAPEEDEYPIEYPADDEAAPQMRSPSERRQSLGVPGELPHPEELDTDWYQYYQNRYEEIRAEIRREVWAVPDAAIPPPMPGMLPGGAEDDPIAISSDDDFEGSSGLSSLDSDGDW